MKKIKNDRTKDERIDLRLSSEHKELLEKAAALAGVSVSSYVLSNSLVVARKDLSNHQKLQLSDRDRDLFIAAIINPPAPNLALSEALTSSHALRYAKGR